MSDDRRWGERDRNWAGDRDRYDNEYGRREAPRADAARRPGASPNPRGDYGDGRAPNDHGASDYGSSDYGREFGAARGARSDRDSLRDYLRDYGRDDYRASSPRDQDRGLFDRAGDEVSSWFGDRDAERRRQDDRNRSDGEHRGRGPSGYRRSDERIREDVSDRLSDDSWIDASNIEVHVADGEVTLSGTVHDRRDKRHAEDLAERVSGVSHVQNNLRMKSATGGLQTPGGSQAQGTPYGGTSQAATNRAATGSDSTTSASGSQPQSTASVGAHQTSVASATAKETL